MGKQRKPNTIQKRIQRVVLLTCSAVLALTCFIYFIYEVYSFKNNSITHLSVLGKMAASNSTAALAFDDKDAASEILASLKAERHITAACIYDSTGKLFSKYPANLPDSAFPKIKKADSYQFSFAELQGFQPILLDTKQVGTLYLRADTKFITERLKLQLAIALGVLLIAIILAYFISRRLQKRVSDPILSLASTAKLVSESHDYSVRVHKLADDETGVLTDAFNTMLREIERQNEEIISFNYTLEKKVDERTNELAAANLELESFTYSVSHDLTAPLRHIVTFTNQFIYKHGHLVNEDGTKLLDKISAKSSKMMQLIDELLTFSKLGKQELKREYINVTEMVTSVSNELVKLEGDRKIKMVIHPVPAIYADKITVQQVWENLISNAVKYTRHKAEAMIEIGSQETEEETIYCIQDNGAGFDMEYYDKLFTAFQRLHSPHEFEGTGVGLAIVEKIVTKHNGRIWAVSAPDKGSIFYFSLPKKLGVQLELTERVEFSTQ